VAVDMLRSSSLKDWAHHGRTLGEQLERFLLSMKKVKILGPLYSQAKKTDILSFAYEGAHSSDVGEILDQMGIAVRAGHLCAQPLMTTLGVSGSVRVSLAPYNNQNDIEYFMKAMQKVGELL
jgi:cysteine desulfurase/selenocysteine lyase